MARSGKGTRGYEVRAGRGRQRPSRPLQRPGNFVIDPAIAAERAALEDDLTA